MKEIKYCLNCGKEMLIPACKLKTGRGKFCSHACNASFNHKGLNKPMTDNHKQNLSKALKGRPAWNKLPMIDLICKQCGQSFKVNNPRKDTARFCSRTCQSLFKKTITGLNHPLYTRQPMKCEWCGKESWVKPAKLHEFRFCSRSCHGSWVSRNTHSPTKPENIVDEALTKLRLPFNREYRVGRYQCDFVLLGYKLVIEVDGDYWHSLPKQKISDKRKDTYLTNNGWRILRFRECDIYKNLSNCLVRINKYIPLIQNG